jgi:hypothetical protein
VLSEFELVSFDHRSRKHKIRAFGMGGSEYKLRPRSQSGRLLTPISVVVGALLSAIFTTLFALSVGAAEVQIISVEYKGPLKGRDFTASGIVNCRKQEVCDFSCNNGTYGDVEAGQLKVCLIKYSCGDGPTLERTVMEHPYRYENLLDCRGK